jgi:predicted nucleic acid-binding protein
MTQILYDTSVYATALRQGDEDILLTRSLQNGSLLWLSAVVLEELYAGAATPAIRKAIAKLERDFIGTKRMLTPALSDWTKTGHILASIAMKYGYESIGRGRLTNDVLIAVSAARQGVTLLTVNERDFARIAEFCPVEWQLWQ